VRQKANLHPLPFYTIEFTSPGHSQGLPSHPRQRKWAEKCRDVFKSAFSDWHPKDAEFNLAQHLTKVAGITCSETIYVPVNQLKEVRENIRQIETRILSAPCSTLQLCHACCHIRNAEDFGWAPPSSTGSASLSPTEIQTAGVYQLVGGYRSLRALLPSVTQIDGLKSWLSRPSQTIQTYHTHWIASGICAGNRISLVWRWIQMNVCRRISCSGRKNI
jgi:hypothetical protein